MSVCVRFIQLMAIGLLWSSSFWTPVSAQGTFDTFISPPPPSSNNNKQAFDFQTFLSSQLTARSRLQSKPANSQQLQMVSSTIKWHDVIERLFEVRCLADRMIIVLHYEKNYSRLPPIIVDILQKAKLYAEAGGFNSPTCSSSPDGIGGEEGAVVLALDYDDCGVEMGQATNESIGYSTTIIAEANFNVSWVRSNDQLESTGETKQENSIREIRESYRFQCVHPLRSRNSAEKATFSLLLSDEKYPKSYWTYPRSVDLGNLVYLYSEVTLPWYKETGLYSFPVTCWTSPHQSSGATKGRRKLFVKDGCPVNDSRGRGLSYIHHFKDGPTKVSVNLGQYLLFGEAIAADDIDKKNESTSDGFEKQNVISLNCEVVPCVQSFTFGLLNVPKCPISYFCAGIPQLSHALPVQLRSVPRTIVSAGPLSVKDKQALVQQPGPSAKPNDSCKLACSRNSESKEKRINSGNKQRVVASSVSIQQGVRTQIVVIVAFISFIFGLFVMGALWWIHDRTDPTRSKSAPRSTANGNSGLPASGTSSTNKAQNSNGQPSKPLRLSRMRFRSSTNDNSSSGNYPPNANLDEATNATKSNFLLQTFRIQVDDENKNTASSSASPASSLLTKQDSSANNDASTARRVLNTLR